VSVLYGYPAGALGSPVPFLEVFLRDTVPADEPALLRTTLPALAGFREHGQHTIRIPLNEENLSPARAALPHIWEIYGRIHENAA
jgi:hypothetical protein